MQMMMMIQMGNGDTTVQNFFDLQAIFPEYFGFIHRELFNFFDHLVFWIELTGGSVCKGMVTGTYIKGAIKAEMGSDVQFGIAFGYLHGAIKAAAVRNNRGT